MQAKKAAHMQRGDTYFAKEKYQEAVIELTNALKLDPKDARVHYKLALAYLKQGDLQHLQKAFHALEQSVALDPSLTDAQLKLGQLYLLANKFDEAQGKATLVLHGDANNVEAHIILGGAYAGEQDLHQAINALRTAIRLDPKLIGQYLNLAELYRLNKDIQAAEKTYPTRRR